jgi:eukaryotic-like serine/threonine-protein kinase
MVEQFLCRYTPTGETIKGGHGEVIICIDEHLERKVAIKFISSDIDKRRLLDEIKALQTIRSKHVVQIFDILVMQDPTRIGIIQEYIPGKDLYEINGSKSIEKEKYLNLIYQIASGLSDIHKQGIVHRDIKLNNIKLDQENIVKIFDFGLARLLNADVSTLGFVGTQCFAAPELYMSGIVDFTEAIDVYAFGVTAWLLSGADLPDVLKICPPMGYDKSFSFSDLTYGLEDEICKTLDLTLSIEPSDRPEMSVVADMLKKYLLRGKHKAVVVSDGKVYELTGNRRSVALAFKNLGSIDIKYDNLNFKVSMVKGSAYINNQVIDSGYTLPSNCVITLGDGKSRKFITFDISNPEVVL